MNEKVGKKPWFKKWWVWVLAVVVVGVIASQMGSEEKEQGKGQNNKPADEWVTIIDFNGDLSNNNKEALSDVFELNGKEIRVTYSISASSTTGTALIYLLPEGTTKSTDADGNLDISIQDISTIGSKTNEKKTLTKEAGKYYIDINTSSVDSYKIKIEEKK